MKSNKTLIGLSEDITVISPHGKRTVHARIDTGATMSSIDVKLAAELKLGPVERVKQVKSANGVELRPIVTTTIELAGKTFTAPFSLADRSHMKFRALIGTDILKKGFLVDPTKNPTENGE